MNGSDGYLNAVSQESLEVLNHFGAEAPALLNRYSCVVEDALLEQAKQTNETLGQLQTLAGKFEGAQSVIKTAAEDNAAYHVMLTNPDMLAEYVGDFFGPNGPYPTETAQDRLAAEVAANDQRFQSPQTLQAPPQQQPVQQAPSFARPQMDMPAPGVQSKAGDADFWATFSAMSDRNPAAAWQMLNQATPDALRSKVLVSEA